MSPASGHAAPAPASAPAPAPAPAPTLTRQDLLGLPTVELHVHLEGSFSPERVAELARAAGEPAVEERVAWAFATEDLADFLAALDWWCSLVRTEEQALDQAAGFARFLGASGVAYAEVTVNPTHWTGLPRPQLVAAVCAGFDQAANEGAADCRLVVSLRRDQPDDQVRQVLAELARERPARVVGLGVDGDERQPGAHRPVFGEAFTEARRIGLGVTAHAGESSGPEGVVAALEELGVRRIDHGVRAAEDPGLLARLAAEAVTLSVCPTSNAHLLYGSLERHPLPLLDQAGVPLSIGTDDPLTFGIDLPEELARAAAVGGWGMARLAQAQRAGVQAAFCDATTREHLTRHLDAWDRVPSEART